MRMCVRARVFVFFVHIYICFAYCQRHIKLNFPASIVAVGLSSSGDSARDRYKIIVQKNTSRCSTFNEDTEWDDNEKQNKWNENSAKIKRDTYQSECFVSETRAEERLSLCVCVWIILCASEEILCVYQSCFFFLRVFDNKRYQRFKSIVSRSFLSRNVSVRMNMFVCIWDVLAAIQWNFSNQTKEGKNKEEEEDKRTTGPRKR